MWDRTILMGLLMCLLGGGVAYDRYLVSLGEVSPISRLIDFIGLADFTDPGGETRTTELHKKFITGLNQDLERLKGIHRRIEEQRALLVEHRRDILKRLKDINDEVTLVAEKYSKILRDEQKTIEENIPEIKVKAQEVVHTFTLMSAELKREDYLKAKNEMISMLSYWGDPLEEIPTLGQIFEIGDQVFENRPGGVVFNCPEGQSCLENELDGFAEELSQKVRDLFKEADQGVEDLVSSVNRLDNEYEEFQVNSQASEDFSQENSEQIEIEFEELSKQLLSYLDEDLISLMVLYDELWEEERLIFENLELNVSRIEEQNERLDSKMNTLTNAIPRISRVSRLDKKSLREEFDAIRVRRANFAAAYKKNEDNIYSLSYDRWASNKRFVVNLGKRINLDLERIMQERRYAERQSSNYQDDILDKRKTTDISESLAQKREIFEKEGTGIIEDQKQKQKNYVEEQMKLLREKARDQSRYY